MFNLLVKYSGWAQSRDEIPASRLFEYTDAAVTERFSVNSRPHLDELRRLPALFVQETSGDPETQVVRVGTITHARAVGKELSLEYVYDPGIPAISNADLYDVAGELGIEEWEFSRTHWAVKDADLFRALLRCIQPRKLRPRVFSLQDPERIERTLVALMMPFDASFDPVHQALREAVEEAGLSCRRADDIWENPAIIQDIVSLIDRAGVVICDCTGRNPNVFYEAGIAHTLGREVILLTQSANDIPFDMRHLRYLQYLNNGEGRGDLAMRIKSRLNDLVGR